MSNQVYYISTSPGVTEGPFNLSDLASRNLPSYTQVFTHDANEWRSIDQYHELTALVNVSVPNESASAPEADQASKEHANESAMVEKEDSPINEKLFVDAMERGQSGLGDESALAVWDLKEWDEVMSRKSTVKTALVICMVTAGASAFSSWHAIGVLDQIRNQSFSSNVQMMRVAELSDTLESITGFGFFLAYIVSAIVFVRWFQYLYSSLYDRVELRWNKSAGAWSWFIPLVNYFRPVQIANKMIEESSNNEGGRGRVGIWWALWVIGLIVDQLGPNFSDYLQDDLSISELIYQSQWTIVSMIITVLSGFAALGAVNAISKAAETWPAKPIESPNPA